MLGPDGNASIFRDNFKSGIEIELASFFDPCVSFFGRISATERRRQIRSKNLNSANKIPTAFRFVSANKTDMLKSVVFE